MEFKSAVAIKPSLACFGFPGEFRDISPAGSRSAAISARRRTSPAQQAVPSMAMRLYAQQPNAINLHQLELHAIRLPDT
jgi:hypothetical protein